MLSSRRFSGLARALWIATSLGCATASPPARDTGTPFDARPGDAGPDARATDALVLDALVIDAPIDARLADATIDAPLTGDAGRCPAGRTLCGTECVELSSDPEHCGACDNDCTGLPGVDGTRVRCFSSTCSLSGACLAGNGDCNTTVTDGCEELLRSPTHCGNCVVSCSGATPVCSADTGGTYRCASGCAGTTPDRCDGFCVDVSTDALHCGGCDMPCTTSVADARPTCAAAVCDFECLPGHHECSGACLDDDAPTSCGSMCTPCFDPANGNATCTGGLCGIACDLGFTSCGGNCVDTMTSAAHCGGCARPCAGACVTGICDTGVRLTLDSGEGQIGYPDQQLPTAIVVRVRDAAMMPLAGVVVTFTAPPGAAITPAMVTTDTMGRATAVARLGRALGAYRFVATAPGALMPANVDAMAIAPPPGVIFPIVNAGHTTGSTTTTGPATTSLIGAARGVAVAADGTVYVADYTNSVVRSISPAGVHSIVAGRSLMPGATGDLGQATMALLRNPSGLALDATANILYVADTGNHVVRAVDLTSGVISRAAGTYAMTGTAAPYGDGAGATSAFLSSPGHVRVGPDGALYVADIGHSRIRRIDRTSGIISTYIDTTPSASCATVAAGLYSCLTDQRVCDVVWDATGHAFVSAQICGTDVGSITHGILRRENDGTLVRVAGTAVGSTADGAPARGTTIAGPGSLALDPAGNLYFVEYTNHRVRRIEGTTATVSTIAGVMTAGYGTDYAPALGLQLSAPWDVAFDGSRHLYVSEVGNFVVRTVWERGASSAAPITLSAFSGATQSIEVDRQVTTALGALLTAGGSPLVGVNLTFRAVDEGAGVVATTAMTTAMGIGAVFGRPGLAPGPYRISASYDDLHGDPVAGSPVTFTITATAPATGTVFTAANVSHTAGAIAGPATYGRIGAIRGIARATDGSVYLADRTQNVIWRLSPAGGLSIYAGRGGTGAFSGDAGPALMAQFNGPSGLAIDPATSTMYVADATNNRIRSIDMATGIVRTFAGGGTATVAPFGDDGSATSATLGGPGNVSVGPTGLVYVSDTTRNRIRVVDPATGIISAWSMGATISCTAAPVVFTGCASNQASCHVLFDPDGTAYVTGQICGTSLTNGTTAAYGVLRRATDGTLSHVAGMRLGVTTEGALATAALITGAGWLARDAGGLLHYADFGAHRVRRIEAGGTVTTVAGTGTAGVGMDYVVSTTAPLNIPWGITFVGSHLFIADSTNNSLRVVW